MKASLGAFLIVLFTAEFLLAGSGYGQGSGTREITLGLQRESLSTALKKIETLSGYRIAYSVQDVEHYKKISLPKATRSIEKTLDLILANTRLEFRMQNNAIIIYRGSRDQAFNSMAIEMVDKVDTTARGKILNDRNEPIESASVVVKGTQNGTYTNTQGEFLIRNIRGDEILEITAIGYIGQELALNGRLSLNVKLVSNASGMEEVVVTALGISRKTKSLSYSTQTVKPSQLTEVRDPNNVLNSLQGKVTNALITQTSGGVGSPAKIILRGNRSLVNNSGALIVIDGIPGDFTGINPDNIESMTVLTGATGAVLYGSEAGNGVIVITTKKGSKNGISVNVNSGITLERPFGLPKVQNEYGQGTIGEINLNVGTSWGAKMTGQTYTNHFGEDVPYSPQPDNIKDFFETGVNLNNAISVSGGSEKSQTFVSYVNNSVKGIIPNNKLVSHIVNLRVTNQISKRFSTDAKITFHRREIKAAPKSGETNTPVMDIYQIPRNVNTAVAERYETLDALGIPIQTPWPSTNRGAYANPYWEVNNDKNDQVRNNIIGFLKAKFMLTDWLAISGSANLDAYNQQVEQRTYQGTLSWARNAGGFYSIANATYMQKWFDVMLEGNNRISDNLRVNYHLGAIYKDNKLDNTLSRADGLLVTNKFSINYASSPFSQQTGTQVQTQSVFGLANLSYKEYLFLDATLRNDWDSRLRSPHDYQYYSFGLSAILSDIFTLRGINFLKAYASYSEVGNGGQFGLLTTPYEYIPGAGDGYLVRSSTLPFPELEPEIIRSIEVGAEVRILDNRLGLTAGYYKNNAFNQLFQLLNPVGSGFSTSYLNAGNIQNQGFEFTVNATPVRKTNFSWDIAFNLGMNKNKVIELNDRITEMNLNSYVDFGAMPRVKVGGSFGDLVANVWQKNDKGQYMVDEDGKPVASDRLGLPPSYIGNFNPKARLGLTNTLGYKDFFMRVLVDGRVGGIMVSGTEMNISYSGITEATTQYRDGGLNLGGVDADGDPVSKTITAQQFWQTASRQRQGAGEFFTYDATNFRVRELSIGYSLRIKPALIKSARISAVARNLCWLYRGSSKLDIPGMKKRKMWTDPDMSLGNGNNLIGVEYGAFPSTRSMGFNLQLTF